MWKSVLSRVGRAGLSILAAGAVQYATNSPYALILVPVLQGLGKYLRNSGYNYIPI